MVGQHILESTTDFEDGLPGCYLAHPEQVHDIVQAGRHGELQNGDGHMSLCGEGLAHDGGLMLHVLDECWTSSWNMGHVIQCEFSHWYITTWCHQSQLVGGPRSGGAGAQ